MNSNPKAYTGKVLIFREDIYWDIGTKEKAEAAFKKLFKLLDEEYDCYHACREEEITNKLVLLQALKKQLDEGSICSILIEEATKQVSLLDHYEFHKKRLDRERKLYEKAKTGDVDAIYKLLDGRKHLEYEEWYIKKVKNPLEDD